MYANIEGLASGNFAPPSHMPVRSPSEDSSADLPTPPDGRRARGDRARNALMQAAVQLASRDGLDGLTFGRLAEQAGTGKSNIQVLFGDREALQLATLDAAMALYRAEVVDPALRSKSALDALQSLLEGWYQFVERRTLPGGCFLNAVSSEFRNQPGPIRERIQVYRELKRTRFRELIAQAQAQGQLRKKLDVDALVVEWVACEAAANVAALMNDKREFRLARSVALRHLQQSVTRHRK